MSGHESCHQEWGQSDLLLGLVINGLGTFKHPLENIYLQLILIVWPHYLINLIFFYTRKFLRIVDI